MNNSTPAILKTTILLILVLILVNMLSACAQLDQWSKPRVQGKHVAHDFTNTSLKQGGFDKLIVSSSLAGGEVNPDALEPVFTAALRNKRSDISINSNGHYSATANVIANELSYREDYLEGMVYKWTKRSVSVSYTVIDNVTGTEAWSGVIETYEELLASYEHTGKSKDKLIDAVIAALLKSEQYPYPSPPSTTNVLRRNFEGFALNLPLEKN